MFTLSDPNIDGMAISKANFSSYLQDKLNYFGSQFSLYQGEFLKEILSLNVYDSMFLGIDKNFGEEMFFLNSAFFIH